MFPSTATNGPGPVHTGCGAPHNMRMQITLWSMGVFTQLASNIKGFGRKFVLKSAFASCVNGALAQG